MPSAGMLKLAQIGLLQKFIWMPSTASGTTSFGLGFFGGLARAAASGGVSCEGVSVAVSAVVLVLIGLVLSP
jgi:hypothetical protein